MQVSSGGRRNTGCGGRHNRRTHCHYSADLRKWAFNPAGDEVCLICGADAIAAPAGPTTGFGETPQDRYSAEPATVTVIDGWSVERSASSHGNDAIDRYVVLREPGAQEALLSLYREGFEPDPAVYEVLRRGAMKVVLLMSSSSSRKGRSHRQDS